MEPQEIFQLIVKADEALKYATDDRADRRRQQAVERLREARREALAIENDALVEQAQRRLDDLGEGELEGGARPTAIQDEQHGERNPRSDSDA